MDHVPTPEEMRDQMRPLNDLDRKVLGGMVALWMAEPGRIRDREWTAQQFVHVATVAHGFDVEEGPASTEDVERIRSYAQANMEEVLRIGLALFVRVAQDMQERDGGFTYENAQECVRIYLEGDA